MFELEFDEFDWVDDSMDVSMDLDQCRLATR